MKLISALLILLLLCSGMSRAQSCIIDGFPLLNQNSSLEDYSNDCGEWAVASILSYWNVKAYHPYTAFDRFLGKDMDPNDPDSRAGIAVLAVQLQDILGYIPNTSNGSLGTNPFQIQEGIAAFCNDEEYGNNYDFVVSAYNDANPFNNDNIWKRAKAEIDQGRPVLFLIAGTVTARADYSDWKTYNLWHYMPVYGYDEDLDGRKALIAASLGNWNSTIYLDVETASNTISSFPDIWTIIPRKDQSEGPVAEISAGVYNGTPDPAVELHTEVTSASVIDHVEYEVNLLGYEWTGAGLSDVAEHEFESVYPTSGIEDAMHVWFRSRAVDFFGNLSEWSYASQYFTIRNSFPEVDEESIPALMTDWNDNSGIKVHPNPTAGKITISMGGSEKGRLKVKVYDEAGLCLYQASAEVVAPSGYVEMDISFLPAGLYLLMIRKDHTVWVEQLIRQ